MNKKIGLAIVTYGTNYGTYLQAFATQTIVQKLGFDAEVINIESVIDSVSRSRKRYFLKQIFNFAEIKSYWCVIVGLVFEKINRNYRIFIGNRKEQFDKFRRERFIFSKVCDSWNGLSQHCLENYANVLVGSDQSVAQGSVRDSLLADARTLDSQKLFEKYFPNTTLVKIKRITRILLLKLGVYRKIQYLLFLKRRKKFGKNS